MLDFDELRKVAQAATPGPWSWQGLSDQDVRLATTHSGRLTILMTNHSRPCTAMTVEEDWVLLEEACRACRRGYEDPHAFQDGWRCEKDDNLSQPWFRTGPEGSAVMRPAKNFAIHEVDYRRDIVGLDNPDATFIATFNPQIVREMLNLIEEQQRRLNTTNELANAMLRSR